MSGDAMDVVVRLAGVRRVFSNGTAALDDFSLELARGEFTALLGPSGCGKSTLLRLIAGLDQPDSGIVEMSVPPEGRGRAPIACVFQDSTLMPWRTAEDNVALPLELLGVGRVERRAAARRALEAVGLADSARCRPAALSGGMRMRASLARALAVDPSLLLLDEPFAAVDEITRHALDERLRALWVERHMTTVFVTHSIQEAAWLADRVLVLSPRPARILLDRCLDLPRVRTPELRTDVRFAEECRALFDALRRGADS